MTPFSLCRCLLAQLMVILMYVHEVCIQMRISQTSVQSILQPSLQIVKGYRVTLPVEIPNPASKLKAGNLQNFLDH